jgi:hypothetical protein
MSEKQQVVPLFVVDSAPTIKWPVTVHLPVDGGVTAAFQFTGIFKRLSDEELDKLLGVKESPKIEPGDGGELVTGMVSSPRMREVLRENAELFPQILIGWEQVRNAAGDDVSFSVEALQAQVVGPNGRFLSFGLWKAVSEIRIGARLGN